MRRLIGMRSFSGDDGAVSVLIAILLVVLLGFGALVIDVGAMYAEVRQLQNGADAAALAIAQQCAGGACGDTAGTANTLANANANDANSNAAVDLNMGAQTVTVTATTRAANGDTFLTHRLGQLLGVPTSTFARSATASWGGPVGSGNTIPLTFSQCEWNLLTGGNPANLPTGERTILFHTQQSNACVVAPGLDSPGGFGWLNTSGPCEATFTMSQVQTSPGNSPATGCTETYLRSLLGQTLLMPIFTTVTGTGNNTYYTIAGFAAFRMSGFRTGGNDTGTISPLAVPCGNPDRCIRGRFVAYYDLGSQPSTTAPNFGAVTVGLTG